MTTKDERDLREYINEGIIWSTYRGGELMTRDEWELEQVVETATVRRYNGHPKLTKDEAIFRIQEARKKYLNSPDKNWPDAYNRRLRLYERFMSYELVRMIKRSDEDPIRLIVNHTYKMDDMMTESESPLTWAHCVFVMKATGNILDLII